MRWEHGQSVPLCLVNFTEQWKILLICYLAPRKGPSASISGTSQRYTLQHPVHDESTKEGLDTTSRCASY